jgi:uncharacterized membrane protein YphA (DoxX/SURF4 family)
MSESPTTKVNEKRKVWNWAKFLPLAARLILGGVFIYASTDKIIHPGAFAETVYNYQILPDTLINLTAIILPWLELILGIFLILGLWLPGAVLLNNLLLVTFFGALVFNLSRGLDIHCGCFSTSQQSPSLCMCLYVIRDGIFFLLGLYLLSHIILRKRRAFAATKP